MDWTQFDLFPSIYEIYEIVKQIDSPNADPRRQQHKREAYKQNKTRLITQLQLKTNWERDGKFG